MDVDIERAIELILTDDFRVKFESLCQMDIIPDIDISEIKHIKTQLIDPLLTNNQENVHRLGNAGRLLGSWIDGVLEYTILKHEVVVLRLKNKRVLDKIQTVSQLWPKKKEFIEGAYKIMLFSKGQRKFASATLDVFKETPKLHVVKYEYFDYPLAFRRVMKSWYERRMQEETEKNRKLTELHNHLLHIRDLRQK